MAIKGHLKTKTLKTKLLTIQLNLVKIILIVKMKLAAH